MKEGERNEESNVEPEETIIPSLNRLLKGPSKNQKSFKTFRSGNNKLTLITLQMGESYL